MKIKTTLVVFILIVLTAGCVSQSAQTPAPPTEPPPLPPTATAEPAPTNTPLPEPEPTPVPPPTDTALPPYPAAAAPAQDRAADQPPYPEPESAADTPAPGETVSIEAADGLTLVGTFYTPQDAPQPWPGLLLLHMLNSDRAVWEEIAPQFTAAGYAVLAVDMRGHGETGGGRDWDKASDDLRRAWRFLADQPAVDPERTAIIGASIGANMSLVTAAGEPSIRTVVLLSPGLDYQGVTTADALQDYGARPILIVASDEDTYAAESSQTLSELASGTAELQRYSGAGHGTRMFAAEPGLSQLILDWLDPIF